MMKVLGMWVFGWVERWRGRDGELRVGIVEVVLWNVGLGGGE